MACPTNVCLVSKGAAEVLKIVSPNQAAATNSRACDTCAPLLRPGACRKEFCRE
jgi:hypothetical protein